MQAIPSISIYSIKFDRLFFVCFIHTILHYIEHFSLIDSWFHISTIIFAMYYLALKDNSTPYPIKCFLISNMIYSVTYIYSFYVLNSDDKAYIKNNVETNLFSLYVMSHSAMLAMIVVFVQQNEAEYRFNGRFYILFSLFAVFVTLLNTFLIYNHLMFLEYPIYRIFCDYTLRKTQKK